MFTCKESENFGLNNFNQKKSSLSPLILKFALLLFLNLLGWADTNNNDSCNNAENIVLNYSTTSGSMSKFDTSDYYTFSIPSAGTLTITTSNASRDLDGYLYNSNCTTQYDKDTSYNNNPIISYNVTSAQSFKFLLYNYDEKSTNYNLVITFISSSPNNLPQITSNGSGSTASIGLNEGIPPVTTVTATDSDNDTLSYSISGGNDQNDFNINSSSGLLSFSSSPDFENPTDSNLNNIYNVTVMVSDGKGGTDTQALTITINDILEDREPGDNINCDYIGTSNERCSDINLNKSFDIRHGGTGYAIYGDFAVTGSSIMCVQGSGGNCNWNYNGYLYDATTKFLNDSNNASFTLNSSNASLKLPDGVTSDEIIYARLYWQGHVGEAGSNHNSKSEYLNDISGWDNITIKTPNSVHNLTAVDGDKNWYGWWGQWKYDGVRFMYQANVDVTNIIKNSYNNGATTYTVGNIVASEGKDSTTLMLLNDTWFEGIYAGYWGGWSLIVVYERDHEEHPEQKYKNIALYDGFDVMFPWSGYTPLDIEIDIDGFLTPLEMPDSGFIDSKMAFLGFGGEKNIPRDYFQMSNQAKTSWDNLTNTANPSNGQFNGSITENGIPITSGRIYNAGMDLDVFDVSSHMNANQSSTSLKLGATYSGSNADQILPSMVAFSTEIYSPRVCYMETLFYNGAEVSATNIPTTGSTIKTSLIIRNDGDEIVDKAKFYTTFDGNYTYDPNTTFIGNTLANDSADSKTFTADNTNLLTVNTDQNDTNMSIYLGYGADSNEGGLLNIDAEATVDFNGTFNTTTFTAKNYFVAYENTDLGLTYNGKVFKCVEFDNSFVYTPPLGAFNVVNQNFVGSTVSNDPDTSSNALYTQVVNQSFTVKILSLNEENIVPFTGNDINITLISTPDYSSCGDDDDDCKEGICANSIYNILDMTENNDINFSNFDTDSDGKIDFNFTANKAHESAVFRITYKDNLDDTRYACSLDRFAIKPANYNMDINDTQLIGGKLYQLDINATDLNNNNYTGGYTTNDANLTSKLIIPTGCTITHDVNSSLKTFSDGQNISFIKTKNIGDYNITIFDINWTDIDNINNGKIFQDCVVGSSSNTHNSNGQVGCDINTTKQFTFSPKDFNISLSIADFNSNNFTYISNDANMSATTNMIITARLDDNTTATSYTSGCYAKDINSTIALIDDPTNNVWVTNNEWLTNNDSATNRIIFFDDQNISTKREDNNTAWMKFSTTEGNFTNGIANINASFNFKRSINNPDEPFHIARDDFNITVIDTEDVNGSDFNRTSGDYNATFYYGRVHSPDQRFDEDHGDAKIYYEVYCDDCNKTDFNITGNESVDSINWFTNTLHKNSDGNVSKYTSSANVKFDDTVYTGINVKDTLNNYASINSGDENITVVAPDTPYKDKINMTSNSWLEFNPTDFMVEFYGDSNWAGQGIQGKTVDINISKRQNKRLDW